MSRFGNLVKDCKSCQGSGSCTCWQPLSQAVCSSLGCSPAGHAVHSICCPEENVFGPTSAQSWHVIQSSHTPVAVPGRQSTQVILSLELTLPVAHASQKPSDERYPFGHNTHSVCPGFGDVPGGHAVHVSPSPISFRWHGTQNSDSRENVQRVPRPHGACSDGCERSHVDCTTASV